jgi:hypothetical protein
MQKMIPAEPVPGISEERMGEKSGGGISSMIYLIHCKSYSVPTPSITIKSK